ncbi:MAG: hypothetical protein AAFV93_20905 [Chloroflexota bacterium]
MYSAKIRTEGESAKYFVACCGDGSIRGFCFIEGEPEQMIIAERDKFQEQGNISAFRLSCQIAVDNNMIVKPLMTVSGMNKDDAGPIPADLNG